MRQEYWHRLNILPLPDNVCVRVSVCLCVYYRSLPKDFQHSQYTPQDIPLQHMCPCLPHRNIECPQRTEDQVFNHSQNIVDLHVQIVCV